MARSKKNSEKISDAEYGVDSRYASKKERTSDGKALMEARLERMKNISEDQIIAAKLLQLKYQMEEFIKNPVSENQNFFTGFLKIYIDTLYKKRVHFAKDINVTAVRLSQVLNNHREPKEEFLLRLIVHSEKIYEKICDFHKKTWFQVYFHEKIYDTMSNQSKWRPLVEKQVNISRPIKISKKKKTVDDNVYT